MSVKVDTTMEGLRRDRQEFLDALLRIAGHCYDPAACTVQCVGHLQEQAHEALNAFFGTDEWTYKDVERFRAA